MTTIKTLLKSVCVFAMVAVSTSAIAYTKDDDEKACKKPQFKDFTLPVYQEPEKHEVAPESEFTVMVSPWVDPKSIKLSAKSKPIDFSVESNSSFHRVKSKIPAEFTGQFVRLDISAKATLGCSEKYGWLLKVTEQ
ncbi:MAG: hypothetical protein Q8N35_04055 [Methylococcaceae bacterium]|jgi:hypothetical protein|nr:hypothetical protein [Methylococcaceae bacterium]MDZ4156061.1 hypothetical protein [Methylococcales bacterium]MDP2395120.1 hypothetical protein [Methylococcaceae bacterium]MDP3018738.1 hypothetical protein [Methylococcaceae bacterium]MDP3390545.1 hypothetical protein [Methylococcaceae bacterium]